MVTDTPETTRTDHVRSTRVRCRAVVAATAVVAAVAVLLVALGVFGGDPALIMVVVVLTPLVAGVPWLMCAEDRRALRAYDVALHALTASRADRTEAPAVEVALYGTHRRDERSVRWAGREVARWHADGTVTWAGGAPAEPGECGRERTRSPEVDVVTVGPATFVAWGRLWVDDRGRAWWPPRESELVAPTPRFSWPSETGPAGLVAYLDEVTQRRAEALDEEDELDEDELAV